MTRRIIFVFLLFLAFSSLGAYVYLNSKFQPPPNQLILPEELFSVNFVWKKSSAADSNQIIGPILLPVSVPDYAGRLFMRLDLGAPYSVLFRSELVNIDESILSSSTQDQHGSMFITNWKFLMDTTKILASKIPVVPGGSSSGNSENMFSHPVIGVIGADLIENKRVVLNYKENKLMVGNSFPEIHITNAIFTPLNFKGRRVTINANIKNKENKLMFPASGDYSLLTNKNRWKKLTNDNVMEVTDTINLWGNKIAAVQSSTDASLELAGQEFHLDSITYVKGIPFVQRALMRLSGMTGILGNKPFKDKIILLDTRLERYAVLK